MTGAAVGVLSPAPVMRPAAAVTIESRITAPAMNKVPRGKGGALAGLLMTHPF
jgi:hypothetical protein